MDKETLTALNGSIKKWEDIRDGKALDKSCSNCPLCRMFYLSTGSCEACPVMLKIDFPTCLGTPCEVFADAGGEDKYKVCRGSSLKPGADGLYPITELGKQLAQAEVDFLKSLLPEGKE